MTKDTKAALCALADEMGQDAFRVVDGAVHFYGEMPNSNEEGWWLYADRVEDAVAEYESRCADNA